MNDIVLEASVVNVEPQTEVLVDAVSDAEAVVLDAVVRLENNEFVLSSGGMYGGGALIGSIPEWVLEAVNQRLTTGDGNIAGMVEDLQTALDALETGVNQSISNLEAVNLSQSGLITGLRSDVDENNATIMNVLATKVTAEQASAVALSAIQSKFGADVDAYIGNIASTYVDADSAIATEIDMMQTSLNGVSASITDISSITIETVQNPLWIDDGFGTDPDINDEPRWIDQAKAKKQLEVNADGVITGLLLESGQTSSVTVQSDEFKLVATGQSVASRNPFTVNATTGDITFVGKVSFNSVTDVPALGSTPQQVVDAVNAGNTTTIDGGSITTGTITAGQIAANTIATSNLSTNIGLVNGYVYSSNFNGNVSGDIGMPTAGFRLSSNAAGTSADPTIYGAYIKGGTVDATAIAYESAKIRSTTIATNFGLPYAESTSHNATGSVQIVYAYSDYFYGPSYGAGFLERRVCSNSQKIYIKGTANAQSAGTSQFCYSSLEYSINDGTWTALVTDSYFGSSAVFSISLDSSTVRFRHKADSVTVKTGVFSQITVTTVAGA